MIGELIYIASPYTHHVQSVVERRFEDVCRYAARLMSSGVYVYSPIAHTHPIAMGGELPGDWIYWKEYDRLMISRCDGLHVLQLDGWRESVGVAAEIEIANELGLPVTMVSWEADSE